MVEPSAIQSLGFEYPWYPQSYLSCTLLCVCHLTYGKQLIMVPRCKEKGLGKKKGRKEGKKKEGEHYFYLFILQFILFIVLDW